VCSSPSKESSAESLGAWNAILEAVAAGAEAWSSPAAIAQSTGLTRESVTAGVTLLQHYGWLEGWDRADGHFVTLTTWSADRLGLELVEQNRGRSYRWGPRTARGRFRGCQGQPDDLDCEFADPRAEAPCQRGIRLIGLDMVAWPGPEEATGGTCPVCRGRPLAEGSYCLYCDRLGSRKSTRVRAPRRSIETAKPDCAREKRRMRRLARFKRRPAPV
jgi:hypothetical protein